MFDDIGGKIKGLAVFICVIGIFAAVISGFVFMSDEDTVGIGVIIMIGGSLGAWVGSFFMYGFGQLIQNTDILVEQG